MENSQYKGHPQSVSGNSTTNTSTTQVKDVKVDTATIRHHNNLTTRPLDQQHLRCCFLTRYTLYNWRIDNTIGKTGMSDNNCLPHFNILFQSQVKEPATHSLRKSPYIVMTEKKNLQCQDYTNHPEGLNMPICHLVNNTYPAFCEVFYILYVMQSKRAALKRDKVRYKK